MSNVVAERDNVLRLMDMTILEVRPGYARISMPLAKKVTNGMGFAHGGTIFSLADIAFGVAANEGIENFVVTLNTSIDFINPGAKGPLVAEATCLKNGKRVQHYQVRVTDSDGTLVAQAMTTGYVTTSKQP